MAQDKGQAQAIMQYSFLRVFANDGTIDKNELAFLEKLALEDGRVDDDERRVLARIFDRVSPETVSAEVWREIQDFRAQYGV